MVKDHFPDPSIFQKFLTSEYIKKSPKNSKKHSPAKILRSHVKNPSFNTEL